MGIQKKRIITADLLIENTEILNSFLCFLGAITLLLWLLIDK